MYFTLFLKWYLIFSNTDTRGKRWVLISFLWSGNGTVTQRHIMHPGNNEKKKDEQGQQISTSLLTSMNSYIFNQDSLHNKTSLHYLQWYKKELYANNTVYNLTRVWLLAQCYLNTSWNLLWKKWVLNKINTFMKVGEGAQKLKWDYFSREASGEKCWNELVWDVCEIERD